MFFQKSARRMNRHVPKRTIALEQPQESFGTFLSVQTSLPLGSLCFPSPRPSPRRPRRRGKITVSAPRNWAWSERSVFRNLFVVVLGVLIALIMASVGQTAELRIHRVFGPEIKTGPYKHPARITQLKNGDFYLVYYGGQGEYATNTAVFGSHLKKRQTKWSSPRVIARDPFRSLGNGVIWQAPDDLVWLFYVVRYGETWSSSRVQAKVSKDNAETWSDAFPLALEEGMMVCNAPIVLNNGDYLLPLYHETGNDPEKTGSDSTGLFLRFDVKRKQWKETGRIRSPTGNIQPVPVQLSDNHLVAYCRRGGDFLPTTNGFLIRAESHDGGWTWSEGKNSQFPNPNAAVDFIKLKNGHLLLVFNDSMNERSPLTVAISTDNDRSYSYRRNIAEGPHDYAYPLAVEGHDGKIHVIFTSDERTLINHAVFDEEWVMKGTKGRR